MPSVLSRMPETAADDTSPVTPRLVVSKPTDQLANKHRSATLASRRRTAGPRPVSKDHSQTQSSEWVDIDESPPKRKSSKRRSSQHKDRSIKVSHGTRIETGGSQSELGRFFPRLGRILEGSEPPPSSRSGHTSPDHRRRHREGGTSKRQRYRDESRIPYHRRPARNQPSSSQRRHESFVKANPSLLSVLTSLTGSSDRSSGSGSTITQQSYNKQYNKPTQTLSERYRRSMSEKGSILSSRSRPETPNVFDFLVPSTVASVGADGTDSKSVMSSSSSSHYEASLAGSSEAPDTPSSRSTVPSPTSYRSQSVAELRRRYDPQYTTGARSSSRSPDSSIRRRCIQPSVSDVVEDDEASVVQPSASSLLHYSSDRRSSSRSSRASQDSGRRMREQEESMRQHMAYASPMHESQYVNSTFDHQRAPSTSSVQSHPNAHAYEHAMQQYQFPHPPPLLAPQPITPPKWKCQIASTQQPPVPDAPDLSQRTIAGYEMLALEISAGESPVRPLYRKFEYLNHRILLHLQDELCELEEQLRTLDEIIAQMDPAMAEGQRSPASRRAETYSNSEIHHRRTSLLGRIFLKTEQYNRAISAYNDVARSASSAKDEDVRAYQDWMSRHAPVHEMEARFLQAGRDLVLPGKTDEDDASSTKQAALACLPAGLMLPLLLFSLIPTLLGRLVVTALIAGGAFIVAATTRIRHLMPVREWAVCGAAYMLLMAAIAGCVPLHG